MNDNVFRLPSHETFFVNRASNRRGGGVSLLIKTALKCQLLPEFTFMSDDCEVLSVLINTTVYSVLYRPPSGDGKCFLAYADHFLQFVNDNEDTVIWGGNFNIEMFCDNS